MTVPVFYCIDEAYAPFTIISAKSMILNSTSDLDIYIIADDLEPETAGHFIDLKKINPKINVNINIQSLERSFDMIPESYITETNWHTFSIYFRLFLHAMFPDIDKAIYIDADTVVDGDISELYHIDLQGNYLGGVIEPVMEAVQAFKDYTEQAIGIRTDEYINSGMLLMDFRKLREINFDKVCLDLITKYGFETIAPDQDYINTVLYGKILYLDPKWNAISDAAYADIKDPKIIHYRLFSKPWRTKGVIFEKYFWKYAKGTPFYSALRRINTDTYLQMTYAKKDEDMLNKMVKRAYETINSEKPRFSDKKDEIRISSQVLESIL
ncbi:MAG: glycosyltransferase family 8 protein [Candidatus Saccharibacteria bacterium]|nr:glycosyltransferase family 8 protein [Candidatus Saccharibacteria bacterium]